MKEAVKEITIGEAQRISEDAHTDVCKAETFVSFLEGKLAVAQQTLNTAKQKEHEAVSKYKILFTQHVSI